VTAKQLGRKVLNLLRTDPEGWKIDQYYAKYGQFHMWIENSPYADLKVDGTRVGTWWSRRKIRRCIKDLQMEALSRQLQTAEVDSVLSEIEKLTNLRP